MYDMGGLSLGKSKSIVQSFQNFRIREACVTDDSNMILIKKNTKRTNQSIRGVSKAQIQRRRRLGK